jgi:hypothetical protein
VEGAARQQAAAAPGGGVALRVLKHAQRAAGVGRQEQQLGL